MPRPILLLDVMGTLVTEPFLKAVPDALGMNLEDLVAKKHPTTWEEFERGEIDEDELARRFFLDGTRLDVPALKAKMQAAYEYTTGTESLLRELKDVGFAMHALSNYPSWYRLIEDKLGLSRYLAWSFVSCETGVRKPDPEAYRGAARRLGVDPTGCLFVDDREKNCRGALQIGMPAIRYVDTPSLRRALAERGLGVASPSSSE